MENYLADRRRAGMVLRSDAVVIERKPGPRSRRSRTGERTTHKLAGESR